MHPGPVNRGVELNSDVIDGPNSLIVEQVRAASSFAWRSSMNCWPAPPARRRDGNDELASPNSDRRARLSGAIGNLDWRSAGSRPDGWWSAKRG